MPPATCFAHTEVPATAACGGCLRPICAACSIFERGKDLCPPCVRRLQRNGVVRSVLLVVLLVAGVIALIAIALREGGPAPDPRGNEMDLLASRLVEEPCARDVAMKYAAGLFGKGQWRQVVTMGDAFLEGCGHSDQMRVWTYSARMKLSEHAEAVRDVTKLIERSPRNVTYRIWRAQAHEAAKAPEEALADYEEALRLKPEEIQLATLVADVYERRGRPCDALMTLQRHVPLAGGDGPVVSERIRRLSDATVCNIDGKGRAVIPVTGTGSIIAEAVFNGSVRGQFIVDTGATGVVVSPEFARRAGLHLEEGPLRPNWVVGGIVVSRVVKVKSIQVQGAIAKNLEVDLIATPLPADGLLGMEFLSRFEFHTEAGRFEIVERAPRAPK